MSGISHVSVGVNDLERAQAFYDPLMRLLGLPLRGADHQSVDYGLERICFSLERPVNGMPATPGNGVHVAFVAPSRVVVRTFYDDACGSAATR